MNTTLRRFVALGSTSATVAVVLASGALPATATAPDAREARAPVCAPQEGVEITCAINYAGDSSASHTLDLYRPTDATDAPVVLMLHGGGWMAGEAAAMQQRATYFAQNGLAVAAVNYTLSTPTQAAWPTINKDLNTAIGWLGANSAAYDVDGTTLGAFGVSAGGHLAALLAAKGDNVTAAVSLSGVMDLATTYDDSEQSRLAISQLLGCTPAACAKKASKASPETFVDSSSGALLFFNSAEEFIPLSQANDMNATLSAQGIEHELVVMPGRLHAGAYGCEQAVVGGKAGTVVDGALTFLADRLGRPAGILQGDDKC